MSDIIIGPPETPTKIITSPTSVATPSGGRIFNPFHEDFIDQLGHIAVTPGIFAQNRTPLGKTISSATLTNDFLPFVLSPEVQGDFFPTEINENPLLQLKLQQILDADNDEVAQRKINNFFQSHLIAPSPDVVYKNNLDVCPQQSSIQFALQKTSTLLHCGTPKGKFIDKPENSASMVVDVEVQTGLSIFPDTDLSELLKKALQLNKKPSQSPSDSGINLGEPTCQQTKEPYTRSNPFLCSTCQQTHSVNQYRKHSLFIEALDTINDIPPSQLISSKSAPTTDTDDQLSEEIAASQLDLPVSWATESVYQLPGSPTPPVTPIRMDSSMVVAPDLTPIKNISFSNISPKQPVGFTNKFQKNLFFDFNPVSPIAAGRTSPEASAYRKQSMCLMQNESGDVAFHTALDDNFDACSSQKQNIFISPQLSPILPRSPNISHHYPLSSSSANVFKTVDKLVTTMDES